MQPIQDLQPDISVVIPLYNEAESLPELVQWISRVMETHRYSYEIMLIDDGSQDASWEVIQQLHTENKAVRGISFMRNYGKSAALYEGFRACNGRVVITMDADLQDSPDEIPGLYDMITNQGYDLVSGWKKKRYDPITKTLPTKLFNWVTRKMSGISLHDFNCGLKAYRNKVVKNIEVYGEMHRYIPVLAKWAGFGKIGEKVVEHRARKYGVTKFGIERFINGYLDLMTLFFMGRFGKKPMHFFGLIGTVAFAFGFLILLYLSIEKLLFAVPGIADRPLFFFGILLMIIGTQMFATGFLAEFISRQAPQRNAYNVSERLG